MDKNKEGNYTKKVAVNTVVQIIGKIITTAASLILITALTRYLGVSGYGQYVTIFSYVSLTAVFADLGFFWIMVREISKSQDKSYNQKIVNNIMTLRSILGFFVFLVGFGIAFLIPTYDITIKLGIGIISIGWFWTTVNSTYVGVFQSKHRMDKATIAEIVGRLIILGLVLIFIKQGLGLAPILWGYTIGNIANFVVSLALGWQYVPFKLKFDFDIWKKMFWEALPMGIVLLLGVIYIRIDSIILSIIKSPEDVGIYGAPYKILEILILVSGIFMGNVFPIIARYHNEKNPKIYSAIQKSFDFLVILGIPIVVGVFLLATPIIRFVAGQQFLDSATIGPIFGHVANSALVLQFLIFTTGLIYILNIFTNSIVAIGRQRDLIIPNIFIAIVNIVLNVILISKISYIGASIVTIVTQAGLIALAWHILHKYLKDLKISFNIFVKALISAFIMGLVIYFMGGMNMFAIIALAIVVYFIILYLIGGYNKATIKSFMGK